ncbi:MAG: hypothetical protein QM675_08415 [Protaetiibacter sp.]
MTALDRPGIRIVRPLARTPHLESLLVQLAGDPPGAAVLARALDEAGARVRRTELVALHRARGDGVLALLDVLDGGPAPALLLAHLTGPRLSTVLAERERWAAGEAVAALAPVACAVERMHGAGVAHGRLEPARIVMTRDGPVIDGFADAELIAEHAPEAVLSRAAGVAADREALRMLATELLRRVEGPRTHAARSLADTVESADASGLCGLLTTGLRELAAPVPLRAGDTAPEPRPGASPRPPRLLPVVAGGGQPAAQDSGAGWEAWLRARVSGARAAFEAVPGRRRRMLVGASAALSAGAVLLALWPDSPEPAAQASGGSSSAEATIESQTALPSTPALDPDDAVLHADDPLAAVVVLLERREQCIASLSLLCLEGVDQPASAALASDRAGVQALREGQEALLASASPVGARIVERLGDGVLVELGPETAPASLLLMRSEAGWRIRDWIARDEGF